jgi:hypothetical protein
MLFNMLTDASLLELDRHIFWAEATPKSKGRNEEYALNCCRVMVNLIRCVHRRHGICSIVMMI